MNLYVIINIVGDIVEVENIILDGKEITIVKALSKEEYEDYEIDLDKTEDLSYLKEELGKDFYE